MPDEDLEKRVYILEGIDCANCAAKIEAKIRQMPEVGFASVAFATKQLRVSANDQDALLPKMQAVVDSIEDGVTIVPRQRKKISAVSDTKLYIMEGLDCANCAAKIEAKPFRVLAPCASAARRDHRKLAVIDGHIAYVGGINLADEYVGEKLRFGHWKDSALRLTGGVVCDFRQMFLRTWGGENASSAPENICPAAHSAHTMPAIALSDDAEGRIPRAGARILHVVNLSGAFEEQNDFPRILERIASLGVPVQTGGGIRSVQTVKERFLSGADRVVLGTVCVEQPEVLEEAAALYGGKIVAGIDAREGKLTVRGWTVTAEEDAFSFGKKAKALGITDAVFTDVGRDGALTGVNLEATVRMAETGLNVIASGGIRSMEDLEALKKNNVYGAILGRSVYEGTIDLTKAIEEFEC